MKIINVQLIGYIYSNSEQFYRYSNTVQTVKNYWLFISTTQGIWYIFSTNKQPALVYCSYLLTFFCFGFCFCIYCLIIWHTFVWRNAKLLLTFSILCTRMRPLFGLPSFSEDIISNNFSNLMPSAKSVNRSSISIFAFKKGKEQKYAKLFKLKCKVRIFLYHFTTTIITIVTKVLIWG